MTIDPENLLESIMESLERIPNIPVSELPNIDLYMDQLTTFMNERLSHTTRYPEEMRVLTKTMINNYAKADLLPPPFKKKYSRDHLIMLIMIYYFKNIMSISDIHSLLEPVRERFHVDDSEGLKLSDIYTEVCELESSLLDHTKDDIRMKMEKAEGAFADAPAEYQNKMRMFAFISMLAYDVYIKKLLIEKMIDGSYANEASEEKQKRSEKKAEKRKKG